MRHESVPLSETPDLHGAYPRLSEEQLRALAARGQRRPTRPGEVLYRECEENHYFFVILEGRVAVVEGYGKTERLLGVHGPGRFLGEIGLLTGQVALATAVVHEGGAVLAVPVEGLRELMAQDSGLGDLVLRAFLIRRSLLIELGTGFRIIGSRYSPDTRRLLEFAARNLLSHRWIDLERDKEAERLLRGLGVKPEETPVVIWPGGAHHVVQLQEGTIMSARTVVIATGARYRRLDVPRLDHFEGTSVYYAATQVEARVCRGDPVAVVGGGNSAGQATLFLARYAAQVWLLVREHDLGLNMSRYLVDRVQRLENVEVLLNTEVRELIGRDTLEAVVVEDDRTGQRRRLAARAMFVFVGMQPHASWLGDQLALDDRGFILTGVDVPLGKEDGAWRLAGRRPLPLETSRPGVFAAGDVRNGSVKRVASAVGEGAMAVGMAHEYLQAGGG